MFTGVEFLDGTVESTCIVDWIAKPLNTACETAWVVVNIVGIGLMLLVVTIGFLVIKHRYDKKVQLTQKYMKSLGIDLSVTAMNSLDKWEIAKDRVVINRTLGQGAFGTVYGGEAYFDENGWMAVAVKTLKVGSTTEEKLDFLSEAEVMKRFDHKNIVQLLAVCTKSEPVYTIMEFMLYGDLKTFLLARRHLVNDGQHDDSDEISSKMLTNMALDIARALSYLAELKYVHRDVACRNCLINASRVVKLGDFGMTRPMCDNDYYRFNRKGMLPVRWMAPESLMLGVFTPASDVWSYGVVLYEIITFGNFPFQGMSNNQVLDYVKVGNTLSIPAGVKANLETLIKSCWHIDSHKRPPAAEIVEFLANSPRIISPCLDVPLSSVPPMEDTTFGIQFSEGKTRKFSMTLRQRVSNSPSNDVRPLWADFSEPLLLNNHATGSNFITEDIALDQDTNFPL
uniref:receptor protein-tyrosine kinase n=1 Tax=Lygus hesperus TaxID=30085 RepID=A0A0A9YGC2_LYGHE